MTDAIGSARLQPNPTLLESAITGDHVEVFRYGPDDNYQFEVSGETNVEELNIDWTKIELSPEEVDAILDDGETYTEGRRDVFGTHYELRVNGGHRHPKGEPIHTENDDEWEGIDWEKSEIPEADTDRIPTETADDPDTGHEVVIAPDDGLDEEHARLMRKRLIQDGFKEDAVSLREVKND